MLIEYECIKGRVVSTEGIESDEGRWYYVPSLSSVHGGNRMLMWGYYTLEPHSDHYTIKKFFPITEKNI